MDRYRCRRLWERKKYEARSSRAGVRGSCGKQAINMFHNMQIYCAVNLLHGRQVAASVFLVPRWFLYELPRSVQMSRSRREGTQGCKRA